MKKHLAEQTIIFASVTKWIFLSLVIGSIIGFSVTIFLKILQFMENSRDHLSFPYFYFLPIALVVTVWLIKKFAPSAQGHGTEKVIEAIHKRNGKIDIAVIPIKLITTVITIFAGGSVGKEGPGAQIGAGVASAISQFLKFSPQDRKKLVICGISAGFSSVFGTPVAGAIFGVEVLIIGIIMYDVLLPSFIAGFAAFTTAQLMGIEYTYFDLHFYQSVSIDPILIFKVILGGIFFGLISDLFITTISQIEFSLKKLFKNIYLRAFLAGLFLVILSSIFGIRYLGLGLDTISDAIEPYANSDIPWYAFILKTFFTGITLGGGGSGGIITPIFYVGATSGHLFGNLANGDLSLFAALGFVSVLAGTTNTPIASTIMAVELFGLEVAHYAALSVVISFLITGHRSIFPSQILSMKKSEILEVEIGKEIERVEANIDKKEVEKFKNLRSKILEKRERRAKALQRLRKRKVNKR